MRSLNIPYLRNDWRGTTITARAESVYGDDYIASGPAGTNPDSETWEISTIADEPLATQLLKRKIEQTFGQPFEWVNKPSGAMATLYWVRPMKIEWIPQGALASLRLTISSYRGVVP